jgi:DNA-binding response OmpR family regulator
VIDWDIDVRDVIVETLESEGFAVSRASNHHSGREVLIRHAVDVVVVDFSVSHDDDGALHNELKRWGRPIVMISGSIEAMIVSEDNGLQLLKKPFRSTELCEAIHAALASSQFGASKG